jgi:two-component system sensor histidine kinase DesK
VTDVTEPLGGSDRSGGGDLRPTLGRALFGDHLRSSLTGRGGGVLWLIFVVIPIISAVSRRGPALERGLVIAGAVAFVTTYMVLVVNWRRRRSHTTSAALFAVLIALATAMTLADRPGWGFLFIYCAACAALFPPPFGLCGVVLCSVLAAVTAALSGGGAGTGIGVAASSAGVGLMMLLLRDLRVRNEELSQARAELARLAVARERERFARDLHDLLGHTLSVIALKTELAGRLLPDRPGDARREIADVEEVARNALSEVRDAVSGYRRPTLDSELAGARLALSAAGIATRVERAEVALDPAVEALLSWAVREGTTNVIRHSGATQCRVCVRASLSESSAEVIENGHGPASSNGAGHGLEGLAERARAMHGSVEAGPVEAGGFRLAVTVPVGAVVS